MPKIEPKNRKLAIFIVGNLPQVDMFISISKKLKNWNFLIFNADLSKNNIAINKKLTDSNFENRCLNAFNILNLKRQFKILQPEIIITGADHDCIHHSIIYTANSLNIPTLLVQDGILNPQDPTIKNFFYKKNIRFFKFLFNDKFSLVNKFLIVWYELKFMRNANAEKYGHGNCLKMAVYGDAVKRKFINEGIKEDKIIVTGNPKFDKIYQNKNETDKEKICAEFTIPKEKKIILLVTQSFVELKLWNNEQRNQFLSVILKATEKLSNTQLLIKIRFPYEQKENYLEFFKDSGNPTIICQTNPIEELLGLCDVVLTVSSSVGLEAMAYQKPLIIIDLFNESGNTFYKNCGVPIVTNEQELFQNLHSVLTNEIFLKNILIRGQNFVKEQAYLQDGQAASRIADVIINLTNNRQKE